jgi:hypothetical protein
MNENSGPFKVEADTSFHKIQIPEYSEWVCEVTKGVYYRPYKGREPTWWARLMLRVWLGFKWTKVGK